jgi:hypothetical protein
MTRPDHLFLSIDGCLYDTRQPDWMHQPALRDPYMKSFARITTPAALKATLRAGATTDLGGYPLYFVTADGGALSFATVLREFRLVAAAVRDHDRRLGWCVVACDVNWEDDELVCAHTGEKIASAYGPTED